MVWCAVKGISYSRVSLSLSLSLSLTLSSFLFYHLRNQNVNYKFFVVRSLKPNSFKKTKKYFCQEIVNWKKLKTNETTRSNFHWTLNALVVNKPKFIFFFICSGIQKQIVRVVVNNVQLDSDWKSWRVANGNLLCLIDTIASNQVNSVIYRIDYYNNTYPMLTQPNLTLTQLELKVQTYPFKEVTKTNWPNNHWIYSIWCQHILVRVVLYQLSTTLTKICWHLIAPLSIPDFLGEVGLNLALGLATSCCSCLTACWRSACCWLGWGSMIIGDPIKSH